MTAHTLDPAARHLSRLRADFRRSPLATLAELVCRAGYAARGFVYLSVGVIAVLAAADLTPRAEGSLGALEAWGEWPFGLALLWLTGLGLYGFAAWRALQSLFDADHQGHSMKAIASRVGQAVSGVVYGALAVSVFGLIDALEDLREVDDRAKTQESVRSLLEMPGGELLAIAAGAFVVGVGIGNIVQAFARDFCKRLACTGEARRWAKWLGRAGYLGRGLAFLPAGGFLMLAGLRARSAEAEGLGGALQAIEQQPYGTPLLIFVSLGLVAFGLFAFVEARYRRMHVESVVEG